MLASYAVKKTKGRRYPEVEDSGRTAFQRDRDRIIHSKAFRRLSGKTQVFVANFGDHFRDRLSHTLEMTQAARDMARTLNLNEDLAEAIALAHDLGHTPFGHAGEETLNKIMRKFKMHFEHNEQSKRIVEKLEDRYPNFPGLNLTLEVCEGLAKHQTHYDLAGKKIIGKTLEAQVVDIADEIAYHSHDLDDGFRGKLFSINDLRSLKIWRRAEKVVIKSAISALIGLMIQDVCKQTMANVRRFRIKKPEDAMKRKTVSFSNKLQKEVSELRKFLWKRMYCAPKVTRHSNKGRKVITFLFWKFYKKPALLPFKLKAKINKREPKEIVIKDYIAGMTDNFALALYEKFS